MILRGQRGALLRGLTRQVAHADLHPDHRQPEQANDDIERQRLGHPTLQQRPAELSCQQVAGDRLQHRRRRGEEGIRQNDDPRDMGHQSRIPTAVRDHHEEGDPCSGAEQHGGADHVQEEEDLVGSFY